jgi:hypothetical protein
MVIVAGFAMQWHSICDSLMYLDEKPIHHAYVKVIGFIVSSRLTRQRD